MARSAAHDLSLNEYCIRHLAGPEPVAVRHPSILRIQERAIEVAGARLIGIVAHGSWARNEMRTSSDVDVLIVVERSLALTRELYRHWDRSPVEWDGRRVDAHFVHLPDAPESAGGVWCEAAIDGIVLDDLDGRVERTLQRIRHAIVDGRLVRKHAHGQPYWTVAA